MSGNDERPVHKTKSYNWLKLGVVLLVIVAFAFGNSSMMFTTYSSGEYSPFPAMMDDIMNPEKAIQRVRISGWVLYKTNMPVEFTEVTLFAADDLLSEIVITNEDGIFFSTLYFSTGQLIRVSILEKVFVESIPYAPKDDSVSIGTFYI